MKKRGILAMAAVMVLTALVKPIPSQAAKLPETLLLYFSSGAGGWSTEIKVKKDGSFVGNYHDSDMGDIGDGYPNGTLYYCSFSGKFKNIKQVGNYRYTMTLSKLVMDNPADQTSYEDGVRYISSVPYGMEKGKEFVLFCPGFSLNKLPQNDEAKGWYTMYLYDTEGDELEAYMLYNKKPKYVFYGD